MRDARDRADFAGAETQAMAIAALRATVEETLTHDGRQLDLRARHAAGRQRGKQAAFYPGELPEDPPAARPPPAGREAWLDAITR